MNPGNSSQCQPSAAKSSRAVTKSTAHSIGGAKVKNAESASEKPAMAKARASRFLEKWSAAPGGATTPGEITTGAPTLSAGRVGGGSGGFV